jgi:hypothetical protein
MKMISLSSVMSKVPIMSTVALLLLVVCTIVHASSCIMTSRSMCALTTHKALAKFMNSIAFIATIFLLAVSPLIYKNLMTKQFYLSIIIITVLIYIVISTLIHSLACLVDKPMCSAINNDVLMNIHNVLLILGSIFIIGFTHVLHIKL